ncbi:MAG: hypothetical protein A3H91_11555 [Gammaproteobacteria bacterium RIFCSPLOWO2_02_FULL_61_13]|nr:MAG: hypothetical protein A3H91_11555 [Gammaproteobacteria bacterium RIFCSPLOWO2_02_FULL_61_13]
MLASLVASIWFGEGRVTYQRDRILPAGQSQLLINLGPPQYRIGTGASERRIAFRDVWYSGLQQGPIDTESPHGSALLGVTFHAHGVFPWLGEDLLMLGGQVVALADVVGAGVLALRERLLNCASLETRFQMVQQWIIGRFSAHRLVHPAVTWTVDRLIASDGRAGIGHLARATGYTRKHLAHLFQQQIGMGPKTLARVLRFRGVLSLLQAAEPLPWAEVADRCGFYDQAHFSNEFRSFSGLTPGEFVRKAQPDDQSIVLL